jgi:hypothetical protein
MSLEIYNPKKISTPYPLKKKKLLPFPEATTALALLAAALGMAALTEALARCLPGSNLNPKLDCDLDGVDLISVVEPEPDVDTGGNGANE